MDLQAEQERRLRRIGVEPETRKFTPHVTLARLRGVAQRRIADYLSSRGALALRKRSRPSVSCSFLPATASGGGPYVVEAAYPLG